jgi:hypothetical protein
VLRRARREVLLRPPSNLARGAAILAYLAAGTALALTVFQTVQGFPGSRLLLLTTGVLVTGQAVGYLRATRRSLRTARTARDLTAFLATVAVIGLATSPAGAVIHSAWQRHPLLWRYDGAILLLGLGVLYLARTLVTLMLGVRHLISNRLTHGIGLAAAAVSRLLLGRGEFAVLLVGVFGPDAALLPAAATLAAGQSILLGLRLSRPFGIGQVGDVILISQLPAERRHRELSVWVYDRFIAGKDGDRLPQAIIRMGLGMVPDVTQAPGAKRYLASRTVYIAQSHLLLDVADEVIGVVEDDVLPRLVGLQRSDVARRLGIARAVADELRARLSFATGDHAAGSAHLLAGADRLSSADLPNLAAFQRVLAAYAAARKDSLSPDTLTDLKAIAEDETLSRVVRRPALRLEAVQLYRQGDEDLARYSWLHAHYAVVGQAEYRTVAAEARIEAGARPRPFGVRKTARNRVREPQLLARSEDMLVDVLMPHIRAATPQVLGSSDEQIQGLSGDG